ncbi:MAG: hypothetical protein IPL46_14795 [Saprospiraceae bacterium]|nr:hypothetical protein [Saprospiraceae bacterium]
MTRIFSDRLLQFEDFVRLDFAIVLIFLSLALRLNGQGLLLDDPHYDLLPRVPDYNEGSKAELETLKDVFKVDLRPFCPVPQDQGFISSCTGWASGYGALTMLKAIKMGWNGQRDLITDNAFSALFVYNQVKKGSCDFGAYISDAAILIRDKGDIPAKDFDKLKMFVIKYLMTRNSKQLRIFA